MELPKIRGVLLLGAGELGEELTDQLAGLAGPALYRLEGELGNRAEVATAHTPPVTPQETDLPKVIDEIKRHLRDTRQAFLVQAEQRDALRNKMERRLQPDDDPPLEYELFFAKYYDQLTEEDHFQFDRIRALTEGPMHDGNQRVLELLNAYPQVRREIPDLDRLRQFLERLAFGRAGINFRSF